MRVYLASSYSRRVEMLDRASQLQGLGHEITSRWLDGHHETRPDIDANGTAAERQSWAWDDCLDIDGSDAIVVCNDGEPGRRGGKHFEAGYAYGKFIFQQTHSRSCPSMDLLAVIGDRSNPFYCLPNWCWFGDWQELIDWLKEGANDGHP